MTAKNKALEWQVDIAPSDIEKYLQKHGQRRVMELMSILGKNQKLYAAVQSEIGQELLNSNMKRMDELLTKLASGQEVAQEERMEYSVRLSILTDWANKIARYRRFATKLKENK